MKKILVFLCFFIFVFGIYKVRDKYDSKKDDIFIREEFNDIDRELWYAGEWQTMFSAYDKLNIENGKLSLLIEETDRGPFILSKPINLKNGDVLSIKRRVKMSYSNEHFTGGLALFETSERDVIPSDMNNFFSSLGNGVVLIEYVHNFDYDSNRPGNHIFRILPRTWEIGGNYQLAEPIFDEWFEEELIYNTATEKIIYRINGEEYTVSSQKMSKRRIRILMHGYGFDTGHELEIDWIEISITSHEE